MCSFEDIFLIGAGGLFLGLGLWVIGGWALSLPRASRSTGWPQVTGEVLSSDYSETRTDDGLIYGVTVTYEYEVGSVRYQSDRVSFGGNFSSNDEARALRAHAKYLPKKQIAVYYDRDNPAFSVLEPGKKLRFLWSGLFFLAVGAGAGAIGVLGEALSC